MVTRRLVGALLTALLLVACGGQGDVPAPIPEIDDDVGDEPDNDAELTYRQAGLVMLIESTAPDGVSFIAGNGSFFEASVVEQVESGDPFEGVLGGCFTGDEGPSLRTPFTLPSGEMIDAGEPLTVEAAGSHFTQLGRDEGFTGDGDFNYYITAEALPEAPLPESGLSLSIPGAEDGFPALSSVAFPTSPAFVLTAPAAGASFALDTTFTWSADTPEAVVVLAGTGGSSEASFVCVTPDTGSFSLPAGTRSALAEAGFTTGSLMTAGRYHYSRYQEGEAELTLMVVRFLELEPFDDPDDFDDGYDDGYDDGFDDGYDDGFDDDYNDGCDDGFGDDFGG
ncbi:hypothetical protein BH24DEI1_BH24DEI1_12410 [soil metagenome]